MSKVIQRKRPPVDVSHTDGLLIIHATGVNTATIIIRVTATERGVKKKPAGDPTDGPSNSQR